MPHAYACAYTHVCTYAHTYAHTYARTHAHPRTHTHTHIHGVVWLNWRHALACNVRSPSALPSVAHTAGGCNRSIKSPMQTVVVISSRVTRAAGHVLVLHFPVTYSVFRHVYVLVKISSRKYPHLKELDDVLGGSAAWENVDATEGRLFTLSSSANTYTHMSLHVCTHALRLLFLPIR